MRVADLFKWVGGVDLGLFLKFYGRVFFSLSAAIFVIVVLIQSFMVAPGWTIVLIVFVLSMFAWILGEILTSKGEPE